jgi:hypothetical protein
VEFLQMPVAPGIIPQVTSESRAQAQPCHGHSSVGCWSTPGADQCIGDTFFVRAWMVRDDEGQVETGVPDAQDVNV